MHILHQLELIVILMFPLNIPPFNPELMLLRMEIPFVLAPEHIMKVYLLTSLFDSQEEGPHNLLLTAKFTRVLWAITPQ